MGDDLSISREGRMGVPGDPKERLRKVANQFEGIFLAQIFKQMENSSLGGENQALGSSPATKQFSQLFHTALTERASGTLGLADTIYKQLLIRARLDQPAVGKTAAIPTLPPRLPEKP